MKNYKTTIIPRKKPTHINIKAGDPVKVSAQFQLSLQMQPTYNDKGRLLKIDFLTYKDTIYTHTFLCDDILKEGSPCGGIFNEMLSLSQITQAYFKGGKRTPSPPENLLMALEKGVCVYQDFVSYKATKIEPHSTFVNITFQKRSLYA